MNIGEKIKNLRNLNKLTQVELAKKSNISRSYLADIEKDRYNASLDTLKSIANALDVSINAFFDKNEPKIENPKSYFLEQYLKLLGFEIIYDEAEGYLILDTPEAQYEISFSDIEELQNSADSFIKFKISEISNRCKKYSKNAQLQNIPIAAHNDFENDEEQQKLMKEDIDEL